MTNEIPLIPIESHEKHVLEILNKHTHALQQAYFELYLDAIRDEPNTRRKLETSLTVMRGVITTLTVVSAKMILPSIKACRPLVIVQLAKIQRDCMDLMERMEQGLEEPSHTLRYDAETGRPVDYTFDFRDMMRGQG